MQPISSTLPCVEICLFVVVVCLFVCLFVFCLFLFVCFFVDEGVSDVVRIFLLLLLFVCVLSFLPFFCFLLLIYNKLM